MLRADFTVPARWKPNSTPLHIAAARGSTSMVKCMLQAFVRATLCFSESVAWLISLVPVLLVRCVVHATLLCRSVHVS